MRSFLELVEDEFSGRILIIDVDGTLVADQGAALPLEVREKLQALNVVSAVHLCSNALPERTQSFADESGVVCLASPHRKPSRRVAESLDLGGRSIVVIGDKAITDGLFAANISAQFVRVSRVRSRESNATRLTYALDALVHPVLRAARPLLPYLVLMRPTQWIKNALVLTPLCFAGEAFNLLALGQSLLAFLVFSLSASAMYVVNDLNDKEQDALHPTKRFRPIAAGTVSVRGVWVLSAFLIAVSIGGAVIIPGIIPIMVLYFIVNVLYSLWLKHIAILDLISVSFSYVLRVLAGGAATGIALSPWIVLCVFFGALVMITGKRRAEYMRTHKRKVLALYSKRTLDVLLIGFGLSAIGSYALYSVLGSHAPQVAFSTLLVTAAILRLLYQIFRGHDAEYPEVLAFKDKWILGITALWIVFMFSVLYLLP